MTLKAAGTYKGAETEACLKELTQSMSVKAETAEVVRQGAVETNLSVAVK